jgi:hypothetical protein
MYLEATLYRKRSSNLENTLYHESQSLFLTGVLFILLAQAGRRFFTNPATQTEDADTNSPSGFLQKDKEPLI